MSSIQCITNNEVLVVDSRLIAEELDIQHESLIKTIKKYQDKIERFGHLAFATDTVTNSVGAVNQTIFFRLNEQQASLIISKSRNGLKPDGINFFASLGFDFSIYQDGNEKRKKRTEKNYSNDLAKKLNGKREVPTLGGNIDILTQTEIIEVKETKMWKHALGQVLVYGHYYPSHKKRIHLYGETQASFLDLIKSHCNKFNVSVTWEA